MQYYQVFISAEIRPQGLNILDHLISKQLVLGGPGQTYRGRAAIKQWKADAAEKYQYTSKPFAVDQEQVKTVVTSHLTGNFPGSPVNLRYFFELEGDKIKSLEIIPLATVQRSTEEGR